LSYIGLKIRYNTGSVMFCKELSYGYSEAQENKSMSPVKRGVP